MDTENNCFSWLADTMRDINCRTGRIKCIVYTATNVDVVIINSSPGNKGRINNNNIIIYTRWRNTHNGDWKLTATIGSLVKLNDFNSLHYSIGWLLLSFVILQHSYNNNTMNTWGLCPSSYNKYLWFCTLTLLFVGREIN